MKKLLSLLLVCMVCAGCTPDKTTDNLKILASFYPIYISTLNIIGDLQGVELALLTQPTAGCLHDYQLTTTDRQRIDSSDVIVLNGLGMESFLDKALEGKTVIDASLGYTTIDAMEEAEEPGHEDHHHEEEQGNQHIFVSPDGTIYQVQRILEGLKTADPANADAYTANATAYIDKLLTLQSNMHASLAPYKGNAIVTIHDSFPYFAKEFDLDIVAVLKKEPESQLSAKELTQAAEIAKRDNVLAIYSEKQYSRDAADALSRETGIPVFELDSAVTGELDNPNAYLETMDYNTQTIALSFGYQP